MNPETARPKLEARLGELATRQYGVVTREQLRCLGVGETGIRERLRTGRLYPLHRGVYALGHKALPYGAHRMAAVLACGEGAVLSHLDAAAHWQIRQSSSGLIHVTVPSYNGRTRRRGIRVHRSGRLGPDEVTVHEGIPITTVARTLLDLADVLSDQSLKRAIDEADYRNLFDLTALIAVVHSNPGRRGKKLMRALEGPRELTRSTLEDRFIAVVERHALPRPRVNAYIAGCGEVDFLWPQALLIVETDGTHAHGTRAAVHRDRAKDLKLRTAGYTVRRYSATQLRYDEDAIAAELAALLSDERASSNAPSRSSTSPASAR